MNSMKNLILSYLFITFSNEKVKKHYSIWTIDSVKNIYIFNKF